jgi:hypothetical protein
MLMLTVREPNTDVLVFLWARVLVSGGKVIEMDGERRRGLR